MAWWPLGCETRSIPDFVRMEQRTVLAVAKGNRDYNAMRPPRRSQESHAIFPYDGGEDARASLEGAFVIRWRTQLAKPLICVERRDSGIEA